MLSRIEIGNYKSIGQAAITLRNRSVIVGQNGVGKSNLLDAIHFLRDAANDSLDHAVTKRHGILSIRRWSKTRPFDITFKAHFIEGEEWGEYRLVIASAGEEFFVKEEEGEWFGISPFSTRDNREPTLLKFHRSLDGRTKFSIDPNPFGEMDTPPVPKSDIVLSQFGARSSTPYSYYFRKLWNQVTSCGAYSIYPNKIREPQSISNSDVLSDDGTNLASIIRQMRATSSRQAREALTNAIRQVIPIVDEIHVKSTAGFYVPVFRVTEISGGPSHDLNMSQISDGTLRMLGMLTAFYQPSAPSRITLEEPEQMIHPGLLPVLMEAADDYLDQPREDTQLLVTTHSPNLLNLFDSIDIIGAKYEEGVSHFSPISKRQIKVIKDRLFTAGELLVAEGIID